MFQERRFFKWNEKDNTTPVKLGDSIDILLGQKIILSKNEEEDFRLKQNHHIWVGSKNGLVNYLYFCRSSGDELLGFDPFEFKYPATKPISNFLSKKYERLDFKNLEEVKANYNGDVLYLIFRDYIPTNIFLMRI